MTESPTAEQTAHALESTPGAPLGWAQLANACYSDALSLGENSGAGRAVLYSAPGELIAAFRGSDDLETWLHDFDAVPIDAGPLGALHAGIWSAYNEIRAGILSAAPGALVGHSLGAALALIAAGDLCVAGKPPASVWAWEPPRVTTTPALAFLLRCAGVAVHIMKHGNDIVPDVPAPLPRLLGGDAWQHPGAVSAFGVAAWPFPNVDDHLMPGILRDAAALPPSF